MTAKARNHGLQTSGSNFYILHGTQNIRTGLEEAALKDLTQYELKFILDHGVIYSHFYLFKITSLRIRVVIYGVLQLYVCEIPQTANFIAGM
jgi:hypothetical protein